MSTADPVALLTGVPSRTSRIRPRHLIAALCVAAAVASIVLAVWPSGGSSAKPHAAADIAYTAPGRAFSLRYPAGWHATAAGATAVAIERRDKSALVTVRETAALQGSLAKLAKGLPAELRGRFADFRPLSARAVRLSTGPALVYTFARTRTNTVETMVVAPAGTHTFTLVAVAKAGAQQAAREAGAIVRSLQAR
jgi:hypothetical protein